PGTAKTLSVAAAIPRLAAVMMGTFRSSSSPRVVGATVFSAVPMSALLPMPAAAGLRPPTYASSISRPVLVGSVGCVPGRLRARTPEPDTRLPHDGRTVRRGHGAAAGCRGPAAAAPPDPGGRAGAAADAGGRASGAERAGAPADDGTRAVGGGRGARR